MNQRDDVHQTVAPEPADLQPSSPPGPKGARGPDSAGPPARAQASDSGEAPPSGRPPSAKATGKRRRPKPQERQETEVESLLGPGVKTPSGIPRSYSPMDASTHAMFRVELPDFAGPLDLLLYLIRRHELDIFDIPIKFITERYHAMLDTLIALPVDVAAEFLVLATELTHIKSKMLLPAKEGVVVEDDDEEEDPREALVRRLLAYQKYRDAAVALEQRDQLGRDVFARVAPTQESQEEVDPGLKGVSIFKLVELMSRMMRRVPEHHTISLDPVRISDRVEYVTGFGQARGGRFSLVQLFQGMLSRAELVITFIAVLEMARLGVIRITLNPQEGALDNPKAQKETKRVESAPQNKTSADDPSAPQNKTSAHDPGGLPGTGSAEDIAPMGAQESTDRREKPSAEEPPELKATVSPTDAQENPEGSEEPLPDIWIVLTGKETVGPVQDDYR